MRSIYVTGANGYLGSRIVSNALRNGFKVCAVVRSRANRSGRARLVEVLDQQNNCDLNNLEVCEADVTTLRSDDLPDFGEDAIIVHSAALVKTNVDAELIWKTNVGGTENILKIAHEIEARCVVAVGTAYSCGSLGEDSKEKVVEAHRQSVAFNNIYEESKAFAEKVVSNSPIRTISLRPSILMHIPSAETVRHDADLNPIGILGWLKLMDASIAIARRYGIPAIELPIEPGVPMNFVDVDMVAQSIIEICGDEFGGRIDRRLMAGSQLMTSVTPVATSKVVEHVKKASGFLNIRCVGRKDVYPRNEAEVFYHKFGGFFSDYANQNLRFKMNPFSTAGVYRDYSIGEGEIRNLIERFFRSDFEGKEYPIVASGPKTPSVFPILEVPRDSLHR